MSKRRMMDSGKGQRESFGLIKKGTGTKLSKTGQLFCLVFLVCGAVAAVHWPVLSAKALSFDDNQYFVENYLVQNPSWESAKRFFTEVLEPSTVDGYYQPLTMVSLMADWGLGGRAENLGTFHRTSLVLHTANTAMIIVLLYVLFGNVWVAAGVGLLFGLHPMTVETVAWVSERKTLLGAFFAFLSLLCYVGWSRKGGWKFYLGCCTAYVLAVLAKPISIPLPVLMVVMDWWPMGRLSRRTIVEKIPIFGIGFVLAIIAYISQSRTAAVLLPGESGAGRVFFILCHNIIFYIQKIMWPVNLSSHYAFPEPMGFANPGVLIGVLGSCVLIPALVISLRWTRIAAASWLFFFIAIFPTMGVIGFTIVIASDKYAYLPAFGILMLICFAAGRLWGKGGGRFRKTAIVSIILLLATGEGVAVRRYLAKWRDTVSLYEHMLTLTPDAAALHSDIGVALQSQGRFGEAIGHFRRAVELWPDYPETRNNLGIAFRMQGRLTEAIRQFHLVLRLQPDHAQTHNNLAIALQMRGDLDEAMVHYRRAIELESDLYDAYNNLGIALKSQGKISEAEGYYRAALRINPVFSQAYNNLGVVLKLQGRLDEAVDCYLRALEITPGFAVAHYNLGNVLLMQNKPGEAIEHFRRTLEITPGNELARIKLKAAIEMLK